MTSLVSSDDTVYFTPEDGERQDLTVEDLTVRLKESLETDEFRRALLSLAPIVMRLSESVKEYQTKVDIAWEHFVKLFTIPPARHSNRLYRKGLPGRHTARWVPGHGLKQFKVLPDGKEMEI